MSVFVKNGITYAMAIKPPRGVWPNRQEGVVLRKTDEKVNVQECAGARQHQRIVWTDVDNNFYVRWEGKFHRIDKWYLYTDCWHIDRTYTALIDA